MNLKICDILEKSIENYQIIDVSAHCYACLFKNSWIFLIFIKNLKFLSWRKIRRKTNQNNIILKKFLISWSISKKNSLTFYLWKMWSSDTIRIKKEKLPGFFIQNVQIKTRCRQTLSRLTRSKEYQFSANYSKLNLIAKRDQYSILFCFRTLT